MTDPINDPTFREDIVHTGAPLRPEESAARKESQAESYRLRKERENNDLTTVLSTEAGQAVIMRILNSCHLYYEGKLDDYAQGQRSVGIHIVRQISEISPEAYPNILLKHARRQQALKDADNHNS